MPTEHSRGKSYTMRRLSTTGVFGLTAVVALLFGAGVTAQQATAPVPVKVTLTVDGETRELITRAATIGEMLTEHDIALGGDDRCSVPLTSVPSEGLILSVTRVRSEVITETTPIDFKTREVFSTELRVGVKKVKIAGKNGEKAIKYRDYYKDGVRTTRVKLEEKITPPTTQLVLVGTQGMTLASRGSFGNRRVMELTATGYGPSGNGKWGMITATGVRCRYGLVAVDPRVIPLGTPLFIEGYGYAIAADTGGAIKGMRVDLFYESDSRAHMVGRKKVRVIILGPPGPIPAYVGDGMFSSICRR